jgi:ribonuclease BN (tRNA processing enzyme)
MAREVKVKKMILTHLGADGYNTIEKRKNGEARAREIFSDTIVATDGLTFEL